MSNWMKTFMGEQVAAPYITTMQNLLGSILFTLVVASFMLVIYRVCHDTLTYNKKFNITLMMLSVISTVLLALIQNCLLYTSISGNHFGERCDCCNANLEI